MTKPDIRPEAVGRLAKLLDADADAQNSQPCEMTGLLPDDERDAAATLRAQAERIAELEAENASFRAVLEGAEYREIDDIAKQDPDMCRMLGMAVSSLTKSEIAKAHNNALREAKAKILTSYQGPRTGGTVAWVLGQIDALIEGYN